MKHTRRAFLKFATAAMALGALSARAQARKKPNIIYILADDLGHGDLSCQGQTKFQTPHLDQLAAEGMRFTDHYSGSTVCAPSRGALMTGMHSGHGLVRGNYETGPRGFGAELALRPQDLTLGEALKREGYRTAAIGKWGMGVDGTTGEPNKKGFDYFYGFLNQAHAHYYYPEYLFRNGEKERIPENAGGKRGKYCTDAFTEECLRFIEESKDGPFFLYAAYTTPHAELLAPEDSMAEFRGRWPETPYVRSAKGGGGKGKRLSAYAGQETPRAAFAAMVTRFDRDIGRIVAKLKALGIDEDTLVMFSSDNGPHKEGGHDPDFFASSGPFRGYKRDLYEGGIRVPFIVRWPGTVKAGAVSNHLSAFWDVLPTVAELAGADAVENIDGISFAPTLLGKDRKQREHEYLYWEFHENKTSAQAVRMGKWKALRHRPGGPVELYDLEADPGETNDLAEKRPKTVGKAREYLDATRTSSKIWPLKYAKS